jgi:hypothetical protein
MKHPITTKDLGSLNELMIFEQWAATKFRMLYDFIDEQEAELKDMFKQICLEHSERRERLFKYLKANKSAGGSK